MFLPIYTKWATVCVLCHAHLQFNRRCARDNAAFAFNVQHNDEMCVKQTSVTRLRCSLHKPSLCRIQWSGGKSTPPGPGGSLWWCHLLVRRSAWIQSGHTQGKQCRIKTEADRQTDRQTDRPPGFVPLRTGLDAGSTSVWWSLCAWCALISGGFSNPTQ